MLFQNFKINQTWLIVLILISTIIYIFLKRVRNEALCDYRPSVAVDEVLETGSPDRLPLPNLPNRQGQFYPAGVYTDSGIGRMFS